MDLEQVWKIREEEIYPSFFGPTSRGIFPLELALFTGQFRQSNVDPRWLHYGVIEFAPISSRRSWLYVTSGHSNPWSNRRRTTAKRVSPVSVLSLRLPQRSRAIGP